METGQPTFGVHHILVTLLFCPNLSDQEQQELKIHVPSFYTQNCDGVACQHPIHLREVLYLSLPNSFIVVLTFYSPEVLRIFIFIYFHVF